jgi:hypothetical protein
LGLFCSFFVKALTAAAVAVAAAAAVVSSDNKAFPTRVELICGCFGLGCGNKLYQVGSPI